MNPSRTIRNRPQLWVQSAESWLLRAPDEIARHSLDLAVLAVSISLITTTRFLHKTVHQE